MGTGCLPGDSTPTGKQEGGAAVSAEDVPRWPNLKYFTMVLLATVHNLWFLAVIKHTRAWAPRCIVLYISIVNAAAFVVAWLRGPGFLAQREKGYYSPVGRVNLSDGTAIFPDFNNGALVISFRDSPRKWKLKFCDTCHVYRPRDAAHCSICGCCVVEKDHHCLWMSTCIGRNNYRPFYVFLFTLFIATVCSLRGWCTTPYPSLPRWLQLSIIILLGIFTLFMAMLLGTYVFLSVVNLTARDVYRRGLEQGMTPSWSGAAVRMLVYTPMIGATETAAQP